MDRLVGVEQPYITRIELLRQGGEFFKQKGEKFGFEYEKILSRCRA